MRAAKKVWPSSSGPPTSGAHTGLYRLLDTDAEWSDQLYWYCRVAVIDVVHRSSGRRLVHTLMNGRNGPTAVEQAYDALLAFVEAAPDGGRLPGERQLAKSLGVSRSTLRTATDRLVRLGLLEVRHGAGTVVRRPAPGGLPLPYREVLGRYSASIDELFELRCIVEPRLAALAAGRRLDDEADVISTLAEREGAAFYEAVARASGNSAAADLIGFLTSLTIDGRPPAGPGGRRVPEILHKRQRVVIASAITAKDPATARESMESHLRTLQRSRHAAAADNPR